MFSNTQYDVIKRFVQVIIPAISSAYFGLAAIWGLPASEEVVGTLAILATFLGVCLGISHTRYENSDEAYDGKIVIFNRPDGGKTFSLELNDNPNKLENKDSVRFRVPNTLSED